jgi:hypothetical protein
MIIYFSSTFIIAFGVAIFEIIIEKDKGWGSGWDKSKWYAKTFADGSRLSVFISKILSIEPPLNYHLLLFAVFVPALLTLECLIFNRSILFFFSVYIGILTVEDFLWFSLNWHFKSFRELLKGPRGSIFWHKSWVRLGNVYLPQTYLIGPIVSAALFSLS